MKFETVNKDARGSISLFEEGKTWFVLLKTNSGFARGGDFHKTRQRAFMFEGRGVWLIMNKSGRLTAKGFGKYQSILLPAKLPHMFVSIEPTISIEWLEGRYEKGYYKEFRDFVNEASTNATLRKRIASAKGPADIVKLVAPFMKK